MYAYRYFPIPYNFFYNFRFMPLNRRDADRNGNCKPGTVVDTGIVVKQGFDFCKLVLIYTIVQYIIYMLLITIYYIVLQSHPVLQGTARPMHYHVLVDDNKFKADDIQSLTNKLCYLNARFVIYN